MTAGRDPTGFLVPSPRPMGPERCVALLRGITSESRDERWGYAGIVNDWDVEWLMVPPEGAPIAAVLGWAALIETDTEGFTRDDLLDSLHSLAVSKLAPRVVLEQVTSDLAREQLTTSEAEGYDLLVDELRDLPVSREPVGARHPVGPARCIELVRGITSELAGSRVTWAGVAAEWVQGGKLDAHEAGAIAAVLGWAALVETSDTFPSRQRMLRALTLLAQPDLAPKTVLEQVTTELARTELYTDETHLLDTLTEQLHRRRGPDPPAPVAHCVELLRGITSQYPPERLAAAAAAGQGELDAYEAATIAAVLGWAAVLESDITGGIRAQMLRSLQTLARADRVAPPVLAQVTSTLAPDQLDPAEVNAYEVLAERLREHGEPEQPPTARNPIGPARCVRLVRGIITEQPFWVATTGDWLVAGEFDANEAATIATVLGWAALLEPSDLLPTRWRVLHSLVLLAQQDLVSLTTLDQVTTTRTGGELDSAEAELHDALLTQLDKQRNGA